MKGGWFKISLGMAMEIAIEQVSQRFKQVPVAESGVEVVEKGDGG